MDLIEPRPAPLIEALPAGWREIVRDKYVLSADLGQSSDPTAISVLHHRKYLGMHPNGNIKERGDLYDIRFLQRLPLNLSYVDQANEIRRLLARPPLDVDTEFILDFSSVGRPVADHFVAAGMDPIKVSITAGDTQTCVGPNIWNVSKILLVSGLDAELDCGRLRFAATLNEAGQMREELADFTRHVSASGRYTYQARATKHDDLVLSVALALWCVKGRPIQQPAAFGTYSNTTTSQNYYGRTPP